MSFQPEPNVIRWKLHLASSPEEVFDALATDEGRSRFWAESAHEEEARITFRFLDHAPVTGRILAQERPSLFKLVYFDSPVEFSLAGDGSGGTDLTLEATDVDESMRTEVIAGWVSVLLAMKAAIDFGVDLRNHDPARTWARGYADN